MKNEAGFAVQKLSIMKRIEALADEPDDIAPCTIFDLLTDRQIAALVACPDTDQCGETAASIGASPATLASLRDLWRGWRDCKAPISLVWRERGDWDGKLYWRQSSLGRRVLASANPHQGLEGSR